MKSRSSNLDADQWEGGRVQFWELRFRSDHLPVILCRLLNLPVSFLESKASNSCLCHMQWSPCKCQGIFLIARVQHKNEKYICESILLCDGRTAQCVGWETDAQLLKFGGGLKKLIENCFKNSSLFLSNCFPGLTICGKCFSSVPLWNSQSNGLVTPLFIFLIMIFSYRFNCWPTYSFWFEGDKTCFLLYWINIYYIDSQVWASGFISKQKRTLFFFFFFLPDWCWVSIFSPDSWLSVLLKESADCGRTMLSRGQRKLQRSTWILPARMEVLFFYAGSPMFQLLNH